MISMRLGKLGMIGLLVMGLTGCWQKVAIECEGTDPSRCLGQTIKISGPMALTEADTAGVMQHPVMTGPEGGYQQYLEYSDEYGQVVLVSKEPIRCRGVVDVIGRLERVSVECQPGQQGKCPYGGYFVYVQDHTCR